jgi:hypothetical protein
MAGKRALQSLKLTITCRVDPAFKRVGMGDHRYQTVSRPIGTFPVQA